MGVRVRVRMGQPPRLAPSGPDGSRYPRLLAAVAVIGALVCLSQGAVLLAFLVAVPAVALMIGDQ